AGAADSGRLDISSWFTRGPNELELLVANTGGPANFTLEVWVDDAPLLSIACDDPGDDCEREEDAPLGYVRRETITIESDAFACVRPVCIDGLEAGAVYLDGVYTGLSAPTTLELPPGAYTAAIGSDNGDPSPDEAADDASEGRYRDRGVEVGDLPLDVVLDDGDLQDPIATSFLIVPIRNVRYPSGDLGVLGDETPERMAEVVGVTGERW